MLNALLDKLAKDMAELKEWRSAQDRLELPSDYLRVASRYTTNAGQSIPHDVATRVNFEDVDFDPTSLVTTGASWAFTVPVTGVYLMVSSVLFDITATWAPGETLNLHFFKNGSVVSIPSRRDIMPASAVYGHLHGADLISCAASDTLHVRAYQASGAALSLYTGGDASQYSFVAITRVF